MTNDIFEKARACITPALIESFFSSPGSKWQSGQFFCLSPLRHDNHVGSFRINKDGLYYDSSTDEGGDFIDLVSKSRNISLKEAAYMIAGEQQPVEPVKKQKPEPVKNWKYFDKETQKEVQEISQSDYWRKKQGNPVSGYAYKDQNGLRYVIVRYEKENLESGAIEKNFIPFHVDAETGKVKPGMPDSIRIPYRYDLILNNPDKKILIVEGEKAAQVEIENYIVTTWPGGVSSVDKVDWTILHDRDVTIWPDADTPGKQAAEKLQGLIQNARIIDVDFFSFPEKYDLADAIDEGTDYLKIITDGPFVEQDQTEFPTGNNEPPEINQDARTYQDDFFFKPLGYTDSSHYFMLTKDRVIISIPRGGFTSSRILSLAPLDYWKEQLFVTNQDAIKITLCQDYLQTLSSYAGRFDDQKIRGTGVWKDGDDYILNTGENLVFNDGTTMEYREYKSRYFYVSSSVYFGELGDAESTAEEGRELNNLYKAHGWSGQMDHLIALGWSLLAPFAGALDWRPHIWITGRFGSGKSHFIENLLSPIIGSFQHSGSAGDTEAGIRRAIQNDPRPVVLDEMKINRQKDEERIRSILSLARDASSNASATRTLAGRDGGTEHFTIRSPFCFSSDQPPALDGAIESRIIKIEAFSANKKDQAEYQRKRKEESLRYILAIKNPKRYRLRIFKRLASIQKDIEYLRDKLIDIVGSQRLADNYAPIFAFAWHIQNDGLISQGVIGAQFVKEIESYFTGTEIETENDEDALIYTILSHKLRTSYDTFKTIAECLDEYTTDEQAANELSRIGIRVVDNNLYIASKSEPIDEILRGTPFAGNYNAQLIRHDLCENQTGRGSQVRFKLGKKRARCFNFREFKKAYIEENEIFGSGE